MTSTKFYGWMNRQGHEKVETQKLFMNQTMQCASEICETAPATITVESTWEDLATLLIRTEQFQAVPEIAYQKMTKAWLDPMTAWITFGRLHPDSEVRSHFSNKAREHAPLQYVAILREIFIVMDPAALDVVREAVAEAAVGWGLESGLEQLSWFSQEPSRAKLARFLKNAIGIVGKHNRGRVDEESDGQDAFVVRAKRWQKDWLTGWLMA